MAKRQAQDDLHLKPIRVTGSTQKSLLCGGLPRTPCQTREPTPSARPSCGERRGIPASRSFQREEGQVWPEMHLMKQYILLQQVYNEMEVHVGCCGVH